MITLMIASDTPVKDAAGAVAGQLRETGNARLQAIGAGAVNQAVKAIALAGVYMEEEGRLVLSNVRRVPVCVRGVTQTGLHFRVIAVNVGESA